MKVIIQRVLSEAKVIVDNQIVGSIPRGYVILLGIEDADNQEDIIWLCKKIIGLRIFNDSDEKMNLSIKDVSGEILVISQFTLHASIKKGNRPSFIKAAKPDFADKMYKEFISHLQEIHKVSVKQGIFGADMKVHLINDGPVTLVIDTKNKE